MTTPSTSPPRQRRRGKFRRDGSGFDGFTLTDRDLDILRAVAEYRFLTAEHLRQLIPGSGQGITRRLQGLFHTKHLDRLRAPVRVKLLKPDELRPVIVYALATKGKEALLAGGSPEEEVGWKPDWNLRGAAHLEHELMVSNFRVCLELALAGHPTAEMAGWLPDDQLKDSVTVEKPKGRVRTVTYRVGPDGYAAVRVAGAHTNLFLEADNNTEEHHRIDYKARAYWFYLTRESAYWQKFEAPERRLVLFVTTSERRLENMMDTVTGIDEFHGRGLRQFWFTCESDFSVANPVSLLAPIWRVVGKVRTDDAGAVTQYEVERKALFERHTEAP
jgi:hypothetical protein